MKYDSPQMQNYFKPGNNMTTNEKRKICQIRLRDIPVKGNFPNMYDDQTCVVSECLMRETQDHIFDCKYLCGEKELLNGRVNYEDIFDSDIDLQYKVMTMRMATRNKVINKTDCASRPMDPGNSVCGPGDDN